MILLPTIIRVLGNARYASLLPFNCNFIEGTMGKSTYYMTWKKYLSARKVRFLLTPSRLGIHLTLVAWHSICLCRADLVGS